MIKTARLNQEKGKRLDRGVNEISWRKGGRLKMYNIKKFEMLNSTNLKLKCIKRIHWEGGVIQEEMQ